MLEYELTPHHAGVALWGDHASLFRLHNFILDVVAHSAYIDNEEGFVVGLAYDARKAYEGQRSQREDPERGRRYGVEVLWPTLLLQVGVLRHAMAFIPTTKLHHAIMFELEHLVESALDEALPDAAADIKRAMYCVGAEPYQHLDDVLESRCRYFISLPAAQRLSVLPALMDTFHPLYPRFTLRANEQVVIPPVVFEHQGAPWPAFEW